MTYPTLGSESAIATVTCTTLFFFITAIVYALRKADGSFMMPLEFFNSVKTPNVHWLSAKNSLPWRQVGLSYFAGGMGAWVYYGSTEMGANTRLSWWGVFGYTMGSTSPALLLIAIAPAIKKFVGDKNGFSVTDFALQRFGRLTQLVAAFMSVMYMFISLCAELGSIANVATLFADRTSYTRKVVLCVVALVTMSYTMAAGFPASVITDRIQGVMIISFMLFFAIFLMAENPVTPSEMDSVSHSRTSGFVVMVTLIIAIISAELFNAGQWQRVYAAKSTVDLRKGLALGAGLIFIVMWFFGVLGVVAAAKYNDDFNAYTKFHYLAYFYLVENLAKGWHFIVLIFATSLCVSSVDSIQNGLTSVMYRDIKKFGLPVNSVRVVCLALNIGAIVVAADKIDVLSLFLMVDLVCAVAAPALYLGMIRKDVNKFIVAPTEFGSLMGVVSGVLAVIIQGAILNLDGAWTDTYGAVHSTKAVAELAPPIVHRAQGAAGNFWLPDGTTIEGGGLQAFGGVRTLSTFILAVCFSAFGTMFFSFLDVTVRGDASRKPLIQLPFDEPVTDTRNPAPLEYEPGEKPAEEEVADAAKPAAKV
jgi:Na+/proline symporter|tara:strand:- start:1358 stop:3124 length:1767 start_codon:yes stop_codon:yes gene_type:complete